METFVARYRNLTVLALAIFTQLLLLGYQIKGDRDVRLIRLWGVTAITPVARVVHGGHEFVAGLWDHYVWLYGAQQQNERLRAELGRLKLENQSLRNALGTADRLKILAAYQQAIPSETLVASVIGAGANPNSRVVFLNKGSGAGVKPDMAVLTPDGIVGKIQSVFPGASLVLLISDANAAVGVILEKSRVHGVMKGTGLNEARIDLIANEEKVTAGEMVYTSGEDRIYPKGLLVGTVSHAQSGRDFQEISLQPGARLNRLEEVLIVTKGMHQDLPETLPRAQAPKSLLPPPPPESGNDPLEVAQPVAASSFGDNYEPQTDADRLKKRYRDLGAMQGHTFGEGTPGSKPPDFNLGWTPPGGTPPPRRPAATPGTPGLPSPATSQAGTPQLGTPQPATPQRGTSQPGMPRPPAGAGARPPATRTAPVER
jgi:rod shape-determining protein MreC